MSDESMFVLQYYQQHFKLEALRILISTLNLSSADRANLAWSLLSNNSDTTPPTTIESSTNPDTASPTIGEPPVEADSTLTAAFSTLSVSSAEATSTPTAIVDEADGYTEIDAALAKGSVLNIHKGIYFNVPMDPKDGVTLYYITRGRKLGVFSGW